MSKYLLALFGACILAVFGVAAVNWFIDVNGVYHPAAREEYAAKYVDALHTSSAGLVFSPYERSVKLALARDTDADCYITGSSHEMQLALANFLPAQPLCRQLINIAVSGAGFEDLLTHIGELSGHRGLRTLYLGIGPWMLRRNSDARWTEEREALLGACEKLAIDCTQYRASARDRLKLFYNVVNGEYFRRNLGVLTDGRPKILSARLKGYSDAIFQPDGSFQYSQQFLAARTSAPIRATDGSYKIQRPYADSQVVAELAASLDVLVRHAVHIEFVFMPYPPEVTACRNAKVCDAMAAVERAVHALSAQTGGEVLGSYDAAACGLTGVDFLDEMHVSAEALGRMRCLKSAAVDTGDARP